MSWLRDAGAPSADLQYARRRDPIGDRVHFALAAAYPLLLAGAGTAAKDGIWILLALVTLVRLPVTWRTYAPLLRQPLIWAMFAWAGWRALSLAWSVDPGSGLDELRAFRGLLLVVLLWPVADRSAWLIGAFLAGVLVHNLEQFAGGQRWLGLEPNPHGRLGGLLHPVQAGALCAAAVCWHLSATLHWRGSAALLAVSLVGGLAAAAGLVFSGSRGPWLAAAVAVPSGLLVIAMRRRETRRSALVLTIGGLALAAATWPWTGDFVRLRSRQAIEQVQAALGPDGEYDSDVGRRIEWWGLSARVLADHPLLGTGAGGFDDAIAARGRPDMGRREHHAHCLYLHEAATLGVTGLGLALVVLGVAAWRAWRGPPDHPYADGTLFVLVGWLIGAAFDCYQLNGTMVGLFGVIATVALAPQLPEPATSHDDESRATPEQDAGVLRPG